MNYFVTEKNNTVSLYALALLNYFQAKSLMLIQERVVISFSRSNFFFLITVVIKSYVGSGFFKIREPDTNKVLTTEIELHKKETHLDRKIFFKI